MTEKTWQTYEEVAQYLLDQFREKFGLARVEGKQEIPGNRSGTSWEIDAKGILEDGVGILIVECRRYTKSRLAQEDLGAVAYRVIDTGAEGAIVVSPLDLQSGAKKVAAAENVVHVRLTPESTTKDYVMQILNDIFLGFHEDVSVKLTESVVIKVLDANRNVVSEKKIL